MGHLINPVAFRLSFFKSWEDTWFVKNIYYPEYLNGMLKLRNYLYYYFTSKGFLRSGIFLSNFFILKYNKIFFINIYIYHIDYEKFSYNSINNLYSSFFSYGRSFKKLKFSSFFELFWRNADLFFFSVLLFRLFKKKKKKKRKVNYFIKFNIFYNSNDLTVYYKKILFGLNEILKNKFKNKKNIEENSIFIDNNKLQISNDNDTITDTNTDNEMSENTELSDNFLYNMFFFNLNKNKNIKKFLSDLKLRRLKYSSKFLYSNFTLLEFLMFLFKKINYRYNSKVFNKIIKIKYLIFVIKLSKYLNKKINKNYNFLLFYLILLLKSIAFRVRINRRFNIKNKIYFLLYEFIGYNFFFKQLKIIVRFLSDLFYLINKLKNIRYKFYFLSNKNITARWLCRYIGLKLKNNYNFYSVLNPVKRELYKLCKLGRKKKKLLGAGKFISLIRNNIKKYKINFKNKIKNFMFIYIKEHFFYYKDNNNFIYDLYTYFNNKFNNKLKKKKSILIFFRLYKYLYINIFINYYWELYLLANNKIIDNILNKIYNFTLINIEFKSNLNLNKFFVSPFFIQCLFNFNYFKHIWLQIKSFNARNIRHNYIRRRASALLGYKLAFKGRFSRKQRASNIWILHGKVPLNTLSIKLDYSFFTIPLKNSAISIKIILYKSIFKTGFKYSLVY